ncbi:hypothetical protein AB0J21_24160 [Streptomyces sp. NPDC049954]|uniref:hypothetical protein n=1 Tax=Streptomyces sp. NPDC049954 TaxID=3155779 RepID=UPI003424ABA9
MTRTSTAPPAPAPPKSMLHEERPFYSSEAVVVPGSGHDVQLHKNATQTNAAILQWVKDAVSWHVSASGPAGRAP